MQFLQYRGEKSVEIAGWCFPQQLIAYSSPIKDAENGVSIGQLSTVNSQFHLHNGIPLNGIPN